MPVLAGGPSPFLRVVVVAALVAACTAGVPATTAPPSIAGASPTGTTAAATATTAAGATPPAPSAEPTEAPRTTDPYANPDDKYTPRPPSTATPAATSETVTEQLVVSVSDDGNYLVGPNGMTLYTFDNDDENVSSCDGGCAAAWPPLGIEHDEVLVGGDGVDGELAVLHRDDDTHQASYNGAPLYYYSADQAPGDTTGDGVNGTWHLAVP